MFGEVAVGSLVRVVALTGLADLGCTLYVEVRFSMEDLVSATWDFSLGDRVLCRLDGDGVEFTVLFTAAAAGELWLLLRLLIGEYLGFSPSILDIELAFLWVVTSVDGNLIVFPFIEIALMFRSTKSILWAVSGFFLSGGSARESVDMVRSSRLPAEAGRTGTDRRVAGDEVREESDEEIICLFILRRAVGVRLGLSCFAAASAGDCFGVCLGSKYLDLTCC